MIPSLILLSILAFWVGTAFRNRFRSPEHLDQFRSVLILTLLLLALLYWGDFFDTLIQKLQ